MAELRPKGMTTEQFSGMMRKHGFPACSRAAISLAERPNESGVQFTQRFRNAAQDLLNATRRRENRKNGNKTTVWLDDELREWVETRAYMEDTSVGELIRRIIWKEKMTQEAEPFRDAAEKAITLTWDRFTTFSKENGEHCSPLQKANRQALKSIEGAASQWRWDKEKAASAVGATETAGDVERTDPSTSDITTKQEENQG